MRFSIIDSANMKIEHDGHQPIMINIREFSKTKLITTDVNKNIVDSFVEINDYIATLTKEQRDIIFQAYRNIFDTFADLIMNVDKLFDIIQANFKTIYNIINVQDIQDFLENNNRFNIPPDITEEFTGEYNESRTFNIPKYKGLTALSIAARMAIPVWGEFSPLRKTTIGSNRLPITLIKMLAGSSILDSSQFGDYEVYSKSTVDAGTHLPELVAGVLGTEFNVTINIAANFVKKVAVSPNLASSKLAKSIFNFTANLGAYNDASGGDLIWTKTDLGQGEEEKSKMEKYSLREPLSQGDVSMVEYFLSDAQRIMRAVVPDIPKQYVKAAKLLAKHLKKLDYIPNDTNARMIQWTLAYVTPPKTVRYVGFDFQRVALAAVTYILVYLGFPHLAALCVSSESISADGFAISYKVVRQPMPENLVAKLNEFYPLTIAGGSVTNAAIIAINNLYTEVNNSVFLVNADEHLEKYLLDNRVINKHLCHGITPSFPIDLANFIIKINEMNENKEALSIQAD